MTLTAAFELTPRNSNYSVSSTNRASMFIYGTFFWPQYTTGYPYSFENQHTEDKLLFHDYLSADPSLDYTTWNNRRIAPYIELFYDLRALGEKKELALVFGFQADSDARLLIYSAAGKLGEEQLLPGDNQFLMEVETLAPINLIFIHARLDGKTYGGSWFFKGISGYVV